MNEQPARPTTPISVLVIGALVLALVGFVVVQWLIGVVIGLLRLAIIIALVAVLVGAALSILGRAGEGRRPR